MGEIFQGDTTLMISPVEVSRTSKTFGKTENLIRSEKNMMFYSSKSGGGFPALNMLKNTSLITGTSSKKYSGDHMKHQDLVNLKLAVIFYIIF